MKYIKTILELKGSTYRSAATALKKKGHKSRVSKLLDWATEKERQDSIEKVKDIGTFDIEILEGYGKDTNQWLNGEFYLLIDFDEERNQEDFEYKMEEGNEGDVFYIILHISLIPVNSNLNKQMDEHFYNYNGSYYISDISLPIGVWNGKRIVSPAPIGMIDNEPAEHRWFFKDRRNANKFRKALIDILKGVVSHNSSKETPGGTKERVMDFLMSSDVEYMDFDDFQDFLSKLGRMNVNSLYKD